MTIIITPTPECPLAYWQARVVGFVVVGIDGVVRLIVEIR